jgi:hypothetical protein
MRTERASAKVGHPGPFNFEYQPYAPPLYMVSTIML